MNGIDGVVPVNEAHRLELERLKVNMEKNRARSELGIAMTEADARMMRERIAHSRELGSLRIALAGETRDALFQNQAEQTNLVLRIAERMKRP